MIDDAAQRYVTTDDQLDALALIEAIASGDEKAERVILSSYIDEGNAGGLVAGLTVISLVLANVGVTQGAWRDVSTALQLTRHGIIDTGDRK